MRSAQKTPLPAHATPDSPATPARSGGGGGAPASGPPPSGAKAPTSVKGPALPAQWAHISPGISSPAVGLPAAAAAASASARSNALAASPPPGVSSGSPATPARAGAGGPADRPGSSLKPSGVKAASLSEELDAFLETEAIRLRKSGFVSAAALASAAERFLSSRPAARSLHVAESAVVLK